MRLTFFTVLFLTAIRLSAQQSWTTGTFPVLPYPGCDYAFMSPGVRATSNTPPWIRGVAYHNGAFLFSGTGPCNQDTRSVLLRSPDTRTWQIPSPTNAQPGGSYNGFFDIDARDGLAVGVGFWGEISLSSDGLTWNTTYPSMISYNLNGVARSPNEIVVVGSTFTSFPAQGVLLRSVNGTTWQPFTISPSASNKGLNAVAYGGGGYWVVGDGIIFRFATNRTGTLQVFATSADSGKLIAIGHGRAVRTGTNQNIYINTDVTTTTWDPLVRPTAAPFDTLIFGAGMFVATAGRDVTWSPNGYNWTVYSNALPTAALDIAYGDGRFVAVAWSSYYVSPVAQLTAGSEKGRMMVSGLVGRQYAILSTNIPGTNAWPTVGAIVLTNSPQAWTDPDTNHSARFYRVMLVP